MRPWHCWEGSCVRAAHPFVRSLFSFAYVHFGVTLSSASSRELALFTVIVFISSAYPAECISLRVFEFCWLSDKKNEEEGERRIFFSSVKKNPLTPRCKVSFRLRGQTVFANLSHQSFTWVLLLHLALYRILLWYKNVRQTIIFGAIFLPAHHFPLDLPSIEGDQQLLGNAHNAVLHTLRYT